MMTNAILEERRAELVAMLRELYRKMSHCEPGDMPWDFCDELNEIISVGSVAPQTLSDFVNLPDAERTEVGRRVADRVDVVMDGSVKEAYRAGFIEACKWPSPVTQDVDSPAFAREFRKWQNEISMFCEGAQPTSSPPCTHS